MLIFETILILLFTATVLSALAKRISIPYPTILALGGALLAFVPGAPQLDLPPQLILALFVAPVLLDAAYDTSLRDLRNNWAPIFSLVLAAVGLTTAAVAFAAQHMIPDLPLAAAIALGALVAPPDAVAALAILGQVNPPHRIRKILEGESLLNDASSLLIYKLAVGAVVAGSFSMEGAVPTFALVIFGSVALGWFAAWPVGLLIRRIEDAPTSVIFQFVITFGVWLVAERLGLSAVVAIVVFGLTMARHNTLPTHLRVSSFAIWESVIFVLNVLAFTLIGLQMRPVLDALDGSGPHLLEAALIILGVVIAVRLVWVMIYAFVRRQLARFRASASLPTPKGALVVGWSGMRGIVTLAAAMALPADFPYRDFMQLTAFVVVLGTLLLHGLTLRPLLMLLRLPKDTIVETEARTARKAALKAAMAELESDSTDAAHRLRLQYKEALSRARNGEDPRDTADNALRRKAVAVSRHAIHDLRRSGAIGDDAYRLVEEELDWVEMSVRPTKP